jgi:hypothetical protein
LRDSFFCWTPPEQQAAEQRDDPNSDTPVVHPVDDGEPDGDGAEQD